MAKFSRKPEGAEEIERFQCTETRTTSDRIGGNQQLCAFWFFKPEGAPRGLYVIRSAFRVVMNQL